MFFYVTELSGTINVVYIRHDVWKSMSRPFLKSYFKQYLLENKECQEHRSFSNSNFNHRNLRLIPKKSGSDFRVIAVPCKGINLQEVSDYNDYFKNAVKPTKIILERLRIRKSTKFAKAFSPVEIPMIISEYKRKLINKYGFVPNLHLLKFDIQSCYDSIPVDRVMKLIKREISSSKEFFLRSEDVLSLDSTRLKKRFFINGDSTKNKNDIVIDSVKSVVLSQLDILSVLEMELFKTSIVYRGKCYLRKDGLFQGTPLSSVLVDILYDNLLESYEEFKHADDNNALIIRLVDDFLVISPSKPYIDRINAIAQPGFKSFNAKVNPKKVLITSSQLPGSESVPFCALQINLKTLEVWKDHSSYNVISGDFTSTKQIFEKLLWIFEMRLSYNMLDTNLNSLNIALLYIREVSLNLAESFISLFDKKKPTKTAFIQFMLNIFERVDLHLASNNITSAEKSSGLKRTVMSVFIQQLGLRRDKFKDILGTMDELNASII
ncbi:Telomerase reverse transcriptase [Kluyveromyces marxianus]